MKKRLIAALRRNEIYVTAAVIGVLFVAAMGSVAWMLRNSIVMPPHEALSDGDLKRVFATAYLRYREDDGTPYLKVEIHNGTLWWIKRVEFEFDGTEYAVSDSYAFRPLHFGALRCRLKKKPPSGVPGEYDLTILNAYGYPPPELAVDDRSDRMAQDLKKDRSAR